MDVVIIFTTNVTIFVTHPKAIFVTPGFINLCRKNVVFTNTSTGIGAQL